MEPSPTADSRTSVLGYAAASCSIRVALTRLVVDHATSAACPGMTVRSWGVVIAGGMSISLADTAKKPSVVSDGQTTSVASSGRTATWPDSAPAATWKLAATLRDAPAGTATLPGPATDGTTAGLLDEKRRL